MVVVLWDKSRTYECEVCRKQLHWVPPRRLWSHMTNYDGPFHFPVLPGQLASKVCSCGGPKNMYWRLCKPCDSNMKMNRPQRTRRMEDDSPALQDLENAEHEDDQRMSSYPLTHPPHPPGEECGSCWVVHHGDVDCEVCENAWLREVGLRVLPKAGIVERDELRG